MSSTVTRLLAAPFGDPSKPHPRCRDAHLPIDINSIRSWQSVLQESRSHTSLHSGLPTPPETTAMTGVGLNHQSVVQGALPHYYPSKFASTGQTAPRSGGGGGGGGGGTSGLQDCLGTHVHSRSHGSVARHPLFWSANNNPASGKDEPLSLPDAGIAAHLQIPSSINDSKGSLAEFTAEMTCLFWFESAATLRRAEEHSMWHDEAVVPLASDTLPTVGFLKWVTTIWSTTQVTQNVILLALLFIHRLKKSNPAVSGKKGSEYRLLTVALMLGNKFLDDNTYTNKTWAEVSGISVSEIHVMEVEFLSNMRYNLYVSEQEWKRWLVKLGRLSNYFSKARKSSAVNMTRPQTVIPSITETFPAKLLSPSSSARQNSAYSMHQHNLPNPLTVAPRLSLSPVRPAMDHGNVLGRRKRSNEVEADMPFAKRFIHSRSSSQSPAVPSSALSASYTPGSNASCSLPAGTPNSTGSVPRLPMPQCPLTSDATGRPYHVLAPLSIPSSRTMSVSYPATTNRWPEPVTPARTMPPSNLDLYAHSISKMSDQPRNQYATGHSSPSPAEYGASTPTQNSPLSILNYRNSPYRPVRGVNTLLISPPSTSFHNTTRHISFDQMRYQPLGKTLTEARTGIVPYLPQANWQQSWTGPPPPSQSAFST